MIESTSPQALHGALSGASRPRIVDVRSPAEFRRRHVPGAENVPLGGDIAAILLQDGEEASGVCVVCETGARALLAAEELSKKGLSRVSVLEGGTQAWVAAGFPIEGRGGRAVSIERQVRIAAGSLVLSGVILGALVNPLFYGLSGFVGCGLVFAGITDWCGMGLLLARAPWNR